MARGVLWDVASWSLFCLTRCWRFCRSRLPVLGRWRFRALLIFWAWHYKSPSLLTFLLINIINNREQRMLTCAAAMSSIRCRFYRGMLLSKSYEQKKDFDTNSSKILEYSTLHSDLSSSLCLHSQICSKSHYPQPISQARYSHLLILFGLPYP